MRIAAQKINNRGIKVSKNKMLKATEHYTKQYSQICSILYDKGYIESPTYFDVRDLMKAVIQEYRDLSELLRKERIGELDYSSKRLRFAKRKVTDKEEIELLEVVIKMIEANEALADFGKFCGSAHFQKKNDLITCKASLTVAGKVFNSGKLPLDSPYVRDCFYIPEGKATKGVAYSLIIYKDLLKNLGKSDNITYSDKSLFLGEGFTIADDCEYLDDILENYITCTGEYADELHELVNDYYVSYYSSRTTVAECESFYSKCFISAIQDCIDYINCLRNGQYIGCDEFYVTSSEIYFLVDASETEGMPKVHDRFIGEFLLDYGTGKEINVLNRLLGYNGEFVYEYDPNISKYKVSGLPVTFYHLSTNRGRYIPLEVKYYPLVDVKEEYKGEIVKCYPKARVKNVKIMSVDEMLAFLEVDSLETLDMEIADIVDTTYPYCVSQYKRLVGKLVQALCCVMCDYTLEGHKSPNHVILGEEFNWVTDKNYLDACVEAEILFNRLGF